MITYKRITEACRKDPEGRKGYYMLLRGSDVKHVAAAVNQGIDSHLEACFISGRDRYEPRPGGLECWVSAESLPVLLRRLAEMCDEAHLLASDILSTLKIEGDPFDITSPADRPRRKRREQARSG